MGFRRLSIFAIILLVLLSNSCGASETLPAARMAQITTQTIRITTNGTVRTLDIDGRIVVWADVRNKNCDIYGYDIESKAEFPICTDERDQLDPKISGNIVIWRE